MRSNFVLGRHYDYQDEVYILWTDQSLQTNICPKKNIEQWRFPNSPKDMPDNHLLYRLTPDGVLSIFRGYAWNGPTKARKWPNRLWPSLPHDAFCQMFRLGQITFDQRRQADALYVQLLKENGCSLPTRIIHSAGVFIGSWHARLTR